MMSSTLPFSRRLLVRGCLSLVISVGALAGPLSALAHAPASVSAPKSSRFGAPVIERVSPANRPDDFQAAFKVVLNTMLANYREQVSAPLGVEILNESVPQVKAFFDSVPESESSARDPHTVLSLSYDANAKVNGQRSALCLLRYDSQNRMRLLSGYEYSGLFTKQEILYYLAAHEFGHCMVFHQGTLGKFRVVELKEHELLADQIAMAFFMANGQPEMARKIIRFNRDLVSRPIHIHPEQLQNYYDIMAPVIADQARARSLGGMLDVFKLGTLQD